MVANSLQKIVKTSKLIVETNTDIPVAGQVVRANVYRPLDTEDGKRYPALLSIGPYGKDVHHKDFYGWSWADLDDEHKTDYSVWETPEPTFWTQRGYVVVRIDQRGCGQSPGILDVWGVETTADLITSIEWAVEQPWCTGKVGLMGVSYYASMEWAVAAKKPKGLACIVPWEGMTDLYRDCSRQGGILSNKFIEMWYKKQVSSNQYGLPGKASRNWGPDTIECSLSEEELRKNEVPMFTEALKSKYLDDPYYATRDFNLADIEVPILSVANWGGIALHLRGNVRGYSEVSSKNKWLYFITGRHDVPFYLPEYTSLQKSFLDAWLKGEDDRGWLKGPNAPGGVPAVNLILRAGNPGYNFTAAERTFTRRTETEWPIARTQYTRFYLTPDKTLTREKSTAAGKLTYRGFDGDPVQFTTAPFQEETEITGHILANLVLAIDKGENGEVPTDMDLFVTLRHFDADNKEIYYTGTIGDPVPLCKGWLRASLRKIDETHPTHLPYRPYRAYTRDVVDYPKLGVPFDTLMEVWPTNVIVAPGNRIVFEVSSQATQGSGQFGSDHPVDRPASVLAGSNILFVGGPHDTWVDLPFIPPSLKN